MGRRLNILHTHFLVWRKTFDCYGKSKSQFFSCTAASRATIDLAVGKYFNGGDGISQPRCYFAILQSK
jgi:hypothetical protein